MYQIFLSVLPYLIIKLRSLYKYKIDYSYIYAPTIEHDRSQTTDRFINIILEALQLTS